MPLVCCRPHVGHRPSLDSRPPHTKDRSDVADAQQLPTMCCGERHCDAMASCRRVAGGLGPARWRVRPWCGERHCEPWRYNRRPTSYNRHQVVLHPVAWRAATCTGWCYNRWSTGCNRAVAINVRTSNAKTVTSGTKGCSWNGTALQPAASELQTGTGQCYKPRRKKMGPAM